MKTLVLTTAVAAAVLSGVEVPALAQAPAAAPAGNAFGANAQKHGVAVVDVSYIFKQHKKFRATMDSMKKEMETTESELKADRDKIGQQEEQRNTYQPGSPEYKKADEELARNMAEFNLKMTRLRKEFLEREAKVYYQTYLEVGAAVKYYAEHHDVGLVLRFNGEPVDPNRREDVLREINKPVVFQNQVDITPEILALLNRDQPAQQTARPPGAPGTSIPR